MEPNRDAAQTVLYREIRICVARIRYADPLPAHVVSVTAVSVSQVSVHRVTGLWDILSHELYEGIDQAVRLCQTTQTENGTLNSHQNTCESTFRSKYNWMINGISLSVLFRNLTLTFSSVTSCAQRAIPSLPATPPPKATVSAELQDCPPSTEYEKSNVHGDPESLYRNETPRRLTLFPECSGEMSSAVQSFEVQYASMASPSSDGNALDHQ